MPSKNLISEGIFIAIYIVNLYLFVLPMTAVFYLFSLIITFLYSFGLIVTAGFGLIVTAVFNSLGFIITFFVGDCFRAYLNISLYTTIRYTSITVKEMPLYCVSIC